MTAKEFAFVIEKLQQKDITALKTIYEQFFQKIYYTALGIVKNKNDAYDVAMNVILKLIDYSSDPNQIKNHIGFLITMTRNEAKDFLRKRNRNSNYDMGEFAATAECSDNLWIEDIIAELSEDEQNLFIEHCIWDKKLNEIAAEIGKPYITVKRAYAEIKRKIKQIYN